jgi:succinate dehydrogenase/fumarate reductase flavoprotein subunit
MINNYLYYDVIIMGSGGAGLRAAISSAEKGCKTVIVTKGKINRSGATLLAGANVSADIACDGKSLWEMGFNTDKDDSKEKWFKDIITEGFYLNNDELVSRYVEGAPKRVKELIDWGMKVNGLEGDRAISVEGTGILDTLYRNAKSLNVGFIEDNLVSDIVTEGNKFVGIISIDILSGDISFIGAKSLVIASGGMHFVFPFHSGSTDLTGDGQAAALRAGVEMIDMEMVTFCPLIIKHPLKYRGSILPYILQSFGYGEILNKYGKNFLDDVFEKDVLYYAWHSEWNKLLLSYAFSKEILNGNGTPDGGLYYVMSSSPKEIYKEMYSNWPGFKKGVNPEIMSILENGNALVIAPGAHYFEGGIKINDKMETNVQGIFAAGECTGGLFGANRVSSALTEMLVEGAIAGENATIYAKDINNIKPDKDLIDKYVEPITKPFNVNKGTNVLEMRKYLHDITYANLWVIRDGEKLQTCLSKLDEIKNGIDEIYIKNKSLKYNKEWIEYIELRNVYYCAKAIAKSALLRTESRGVHFRSDYPITNNEEWLKHIIIVDTNFNYRFENIRRGISEAEIKKLSYIDFIRYLVNKLT